MSKPFHSDSLVSRPRDISRPIAASCIPGATNRLKQRKSSRLLRGVPVFDDQSSIPTIKVCSLAWLSPALPLSLRPVPELRLLRLDPDKAL